MIRERRTKELHINDDSPGRDSDAAWLLTRYSMPRGEGKPWVAVNMVASLDGRTAVAGRVGPLTGAADQQLFHHLRSLSDVILVGAATVRAERYRPPVEEGRAVPLAIVSSSLDIPPSVRRDANDPIVFTTDEAATTRTDLNTIGAGSQRVDVSRLVDALHELGYRSILCEGGATLNTMLFEADLVDDVFLTISPFAGGDDLRLTSGSQALRRFSLLHAHSIDQHVFLRYRRCR